MEHSPEPFSRGVVYCLRVRFGLSFTYPVYRDWHSLLRLSPYYSKASVKRYWWWVHTSDLCTDFPRISNVLPWSSVTLSPMSIVAWFPSVSILWI